MKTESEKWSGKTLSQFFSSALKNHYPLLGNVQCLKLKMPSAFLEKTSCSCWNRVEEPVSLVGQSSSGSAMHRGSTFWSSMVPRTIHPFPRLRAWNLKCHLLSWKRRGSSSCSCWNRVEEPVSPVGQSSNNPAFPKMILASTESRLSKLVYRRRRTC